MFASRRKSALFTSAAALFALNLSLPVSAETTAAEPDIAAVAASPDATANAAEIPTPRARPAPARKRTATVVRSVSPRPEPARVAPHYQRLAAHWPVLFIGVGW
jgi:hypothetical protein